MIKGLIFHHIGIATGNIELTSAFYLNTGHSISPIIDDSIQNVKICFISGGLSPLIELVSPLTVTSPVSKIISNQGVVPYHICYEVKDINKSILLLKQHKFIPLNRPVPAIALENRMICFLYSKDYGLIELLQSK